MHSCVVYAYLSIACQYLLALIQFQIIQLNKQELYIADLTASLNFTIFIRQPIKYIQASMKCF